VVYPQFIHYEFYVPIDAGSHRYVGVMVQFREGVDAAWFHARYLTAIRWLFHGNFSNQDAWMVEHTDCPPERLYRPDLSLIGWRRLAEEPNPFLLAPSALPDGAPTPSSSLVVGPQPHDGRSLLAPSALPDGAPTTDVAIADDQNEGG
jgi:hypothetical protein